MILNVHIAGDTATPALRRTLQSLTPARLAAKVGPACQTLTEQHLAALGPNKYGWPSTHFYKKFVHQVSWQRSENGVAIVIAPAEINGRSVSFAQRFYGGPISPVKARALAYPISPISYGKLPSDFPRLFVLKTSKGSYLAQSLPVTSRGIGHSARHTGRAANRVRSRLILLFRLVARVLQAPDPKVLPTSAEYAAAATKAILAT